MRALALVTAAALLGPAGAARAETRPRYAGKLDAPLLGAPATLDPAHAQSHAELTVVGLVFDTLYAFSPSGGVEPHLAAGPPAAVAGAARPTVRIPLRKGVRFHDGSALTAADVAASLERLRGTPARWLVAAVAAARANGDEVELELRGSERAPVELATLLALPYTAITRAGKPPGERPIGTGPYALDALDRPRRRLALRAWDQHFAGRAFVDRLVLHWHDKPDAEARLFEIDELQLSARGAAAFAGAQPKFRARELEGPAALLVFVGFGRAHAEVTADRGFRRALDLALARNAVTGVTSGELVVPAHEPVPVDAGGAVVAPAVRLGDLAAARTALGDAGRRVAALAPARLTALRLEILVEDTRPDDRVLAERVAFALDKLGIASAISAVPAAALRERVARGACDLWIGQLAAPAIAAMAPLWWASAFAAGGDSWPATAAAAGPIDVAAAQREFAARLPIVPLVFRSVKLWHRSDVHGLGFDVTGRPTFADMFTFGAPVPTKGKP